MSEKQIISCVCLTCGIRNDHSHPDGFCQNGHDDWLEYRDVMLTEGAEPWPLKRALRLTRMDAKQFRNLFLNNDFKQFKIYPGAHWIQQANELGTYERTIKGFRVYCVNKPQIKRKEIDRDGEKWMRTDIIKGDFVAIDKTGCIFEAHHLDELAYKIEIELYRRKFQEQDSQQQTNDSE